MYLGPQRFEAPPLKSSSDDEEPPQPARQAAKVSRIRVRVFMPATLSPPAPNRACMNRPPASARQPLQVRRVEVRIVVVDLEVDQLVGLVDHCGGEIALALQVVDDLG